MWVINIVSLSNVSRFNFINHIYYCVLLLLFDTFQHSFLVGN